MVDGARTITDPALLPSIVPRIQTIAQLLLKARDTPADSEQEHEQEHEQTHPLTHASESESAAVAAASAAPAHTSSMALGTVANDELDDWDPWAQVDATGSSVRRISSALLGQLAHETTTLKSTFSAVHAAVDAARGADMSTDDQLALLSKLEAYAQRQACVSTTDIQRYSDDMGPKPIIAN